MNRRKFLSTSIGASFLALSSSERATLSQPRLTLAQRERALRLHREAIVINCHDHMWRNQDLLDMLQGGVTAKIYKPLADGIYWDDQNRRAQPPESFDWTAKYLEYVEKIESLERAGDPPVLIIRGVKDIEEAKRQGKAGIILGNEGSLPLAGSLDVFEDLYKRGLRELALVWIHSRDVLNEDRTLTSFARQVIGKANDLGVVLDPSHLASTPAFGQILAESRSPVIHTHGAPNFPRTRRHGEGDLADDQIRALADSGGVIGLHFCTYIHNLNGHYWSPTLEDLIDHVEHLVKIGGIDCVGIGADHFPYNSKPVRLPYDRIGETLIEDRDWGRTFVVGIENISGMPLFTEGLVARGFSDEDIQKILGGNVLRVLKEVWN